MARRPKVFISYAHADSSFVERFANFLKQRGCEPWVDRHSIELGTEFRREIRRAIHESDAFLLILSRNSAGRDGVLAGELREGLKVFSERLDQGYLIPVRIDDTPLPSEIAHIQAVNAQNEESWERIAATLRSRASRPRRRTVQIAVLIAAAFLAAAALSFALWRKGSPPADSDKNYDIAIRRRPGAPAPPPATGVTQLGVTLWAVRSQKEGARCADLQFTRLALNTPLAWGDQLRFTVEPGQPGYLYIVNQELLRNGDGGEPRLIYPSSVMNQSVQPLAAGRLIEIPPSIGDFCPTFQLNRAGSNHMGERIALIFSQTPLPQLAPGSDVSRPIEAATVRNLRDGSLTTYERSTWDAGVGQPRSAAEQAASDPESARSLNYFDPRPQSLFTAEAQPKALFVEISLTPRE